MKIFPRYELRPRLIGEGRVYELLSQVEDPHGFSVHSLNLPEHQYKRWSEADFVVVSRTGVTILEVKGGSVTLAAREWRYENARGQAITSTEGPAQQALSAAIALEKLLRKHLDRKIRCRWGVVFPLCSFEKPVAELPPERLADVTVCSDVGAFADWLRDIPFDQHSPSDFALTDDVVAAIREILVPEFTAATSLGLAVRSAQEQVHRLTEQQFEILESLEDNARLCISGGAGTGKTELAVLCARAEKTAGRCPAIITSTLPASLALKARAAQYGVPVVSGALPEGTDVLIVDEGQDFVQPEALRTLFDQLPGELSRGRWRWFMDPNLQFMDQPPDEACLDELKHHCVPVTLRRNVRSTKEIVGAIRAFLQADVGISQIDGYGIKVEFHEISDSDSEVSEIEHTVKAMLEDGVHPGEIAILGAGEALGPVCRELLSRLPRTLRSMTVQGGIQSSSHGVVCPIPRFRGLEARVVVLADLDCLPDGVLGESMLYIGMSRASSALHLVVRPATRKYLERLLLRSSDRKQNHGKA